jgi:hypothetical protein
MDIKIFKSTYFKNDFLPSWIGLDAAFCFCAALLSGQRGLSRESYNEYAAIDLSSAKDNYPAPSGLGESQSTPTLETIEKLLFERLSSGTVRSKGKDVFYEIDQDYRIERLTERSSDIDPEFWREHYLLDYAKNTLMVEDNPKGVFDRRIADRDYDTFHGSFHEMERSLFGEITDIQLSSNDLIKSVQSYITSYSPADLSKDIQIDDTKVTGRNRLFYSKSRRQWIIEFNNQVTIYSFKEGSIGLKRVQYILKWTPKSGHLNDSHTYSAVDLLGVSPAVESNDDAVEWQDANYDLASYREVLEQQKQLGAKKPGNREIQNNIAELKQHIEKLTYKGRATITTASGKVKKRVAKSVTRCVDQLSTELNEHFSEFIQKENEYIYYSADVEWDVNDQKGEFL